MIRDFRDARKEARSKAGIRSRRLAAIQVGVIALARMTSAHLAFDILAITSANSVGSAGFGTWL